MFAREKHKPESPNRSSTNRATLIPPYGRTKKKLVSVQTNTDEYTCRRCHELERFQATTEIDEDLRANYIKSINYINSCHTIMNELIQREKTSDSSTTLTMPDLPDFLEMYTVIRKSRSVSTNKTSSTECNEEDKDKKSFVEMLPDIKQLVNEAPPDGVTRSESGSDTEICRRAKNLCIGKKKSKGKKLGGRLLLKTSSIDMTTETSGGKMARTQSALESQEGKEQRKIEMFGDEMFDKYAKDLLETVDGETEKKPKSSLTSMKKVKFADQVASSEDTRATTSKAQNKPDFNFGANMMPSMGGCHNFNPQMFYGAPGMMQGSYPNEHPVYYHNFMMQNQMPFPGGNPNFYMMMANQQQNISRMQQSFECNAKDGANARKTTESIPEESETRKSAESIILDDCEYKKELENSDTDYIPSDSDIELNTKPPTNVACEESSTAARRKPPPVTPPTNGKSHPLKLHERSLPLLDESVVNTMGIFTRDGELSPEAVEKLEFLDAIKMYRTMDGRNKPFRTSRSVSSSDLSGEILKVEERSDSSNSLSSSDVYDEQSNKIMRVTSCTSSSSAEE